MGKHYKLKTIFFLLILVLAVRQGYPQDDNVTFLNNGQEEQSIVSQSPLFSDILIEKIKSAPSGTIIFFTDIIVSIRENRENQRSAENFWVQLN